MNREERKAIKAIKARYIRRLTALVSALVILCIFGAWSSGGVSGLISGKERENRLYPSEAEAVEMAGTLPTVCMPVSECYQKKEDERGFSEELLADLQERVRSGGMQAAIEAYQDDTLLVDVDTLLSLCPDCESLIAKEAMGLQEKDIIDSIISVYRVELDGEALLVECRDLEVSWFLLKKTEEGYLAGYVDFPNYVSPSWERCGRAMFAEGDGYCLLEWTQRDGEELLSLYYFTLREGWLENIGAAIQIFDWEIRYIRETAIKAVPSFFYCNNSHPLTPEVQAYVEENVMLFADRLVEDDLIWGDETPAAPIEKNAVVTWKTGEYEEMYPFEWEIEVSQADYDNDGEAELFWRIHHSVNAPHAEEAENALLTEENGGYRAESISLYGADMPAVELWFAEFAGKTVTFEIVEPYGAEYPLLAAYLVEENKKTPILTCQLVYGKTVESDDNEYVDGDSFQVRQSMPLLAGQEKETIEQTIFQKKLTAWVREACRDVVIEPLQTETPFPADFLEFIREGAAWCFSGRLFSAYAAPYEVNTEKDLEEFKEKYEVEYGWNYDMAYRWEASDGTVNYLVSETLEVASDSLVNTLYWYRDDGDGLYQKEPITDLSCDYGSYCGVLTYGGRLYCVTVAVNLWREPLRIDLIPLGDAGEWEHYCFSFSYEEKTPEMLSLEENMALQAYVEEEAEAIYAACMKETSFYQGRGEAGIIPKEAWRDIKNRDFSYSQNVWYTSAHHDFKPVDADNDGEMEYAAVYMMYGRYQGYTDYTVYGWRDETFAELTLEGEGLLCCYEDRDNGYGIICELDQLWFEEIDGVTYLFTVEKMNLFDGFLMRARVIRDGKVQDAGAWLFRYTGVILQDIQEMGEYESWMSA